MRGRGLSFDLNCLDGMSVFFKSFLVGTGSLVATISMILTVVPLCGEAIQTSMFISGVIGCYSIGSPVSYYCMKQTEKYRAALAREEALHLQLRDTHAELQRRSRRDLMTGLLNRETFLKEMEETKSEHLDQTSSVILLDVDHFKRINDTWGHHTGDEALVLIGTAILEIFGSDGLAGRIGGEEFAVFLLGDDESEATTLGEAIRLKVQQLPFFPVPSCQEKLSLSVGIASASNTIDTTALLKRADAMLYQAKADGRNCVCVNQATKFFGSEDLPPLVIERRSV